MRTKWFGERNKSPKSPTKVHTPTIFVFLKTFLKGIKIALNLLIYSSAEVLLVLAPSPFSGQCDFPGPAPWLDPSQSRTMSYHWPCKNYRRSFLSSPAARGRLVPECANTSEEILKRHHSGEELPPQRDVSRTKEMHKKRWVSKTHLTYLHQITSPT